MAYGTDLVEIWRLADDVHQILDGAKRRHPDLSTDRIRVPDQSQGRQGTRPYGSTRIARDRRRRNRMRRCDFTIGLLLAGTTGAPAQERANQLRIAIVIPAGAVAIISETSNDPLRRRFYQSFFEEQR